jgi:hypothetical protein
MAIIKPEQLRSGSYSISGSFSGSFQGTLTGTSSHAVSSSFATTSSYAFQALSASYSSKTNLTVGSTAISSGTDGRVLFQNGGVLQQSANLFWDNGGTFFRNGWGDNYVGITNGSVMATDGLYAVGWGIFYTGIATDGLVAAIDGGIYTNGAFVGEPPGGPPEPLMEPLDPLNFVESIEPAYQREDWDEQWRLPYKVSDYEEIQYKHRTTEQYGTENAKWFQKFWQREFQHELSPMDYSKDKDSVGENSYPGKKHIDGDKKDLILYAEVNVQEDGSPKLPEEQKKEGGTFTSVPYSEQLFK